MVKTITASPDIAIIINSFNRLELLKECLLVLDSWISNSEFDDKIVAVIYDAGSNDGSIEWLQKQGLNLKFPLKILLPNISDDTSFAAGLNTGAYYAENVWPSLKYFLFYETDNQILGPEPISQALKQLRERKNLAACGFTVRKHNGEPAGVGMPFPSLLNFTLGKNLVQKFNLEKIPYNWKKNVGEAEFSFVDVVFTSPLLVKLHAWKESRGLDSKEFPFSDCDIDWAFRLKEMGWRMGVIKSNDVIHDNKTTLSNWSNSREIQFHKGRLRYFLRHKPISVFLVWPGFLLIRHLCEYFAVKLVVKEPKRRSHLSNQFLNLLKSNLHKYKTY